MADINKRNVAIHKHSVCSVIPFEEKYPTEWKAQEIMPWQHTRIISFTNAHSIIVQTKNNNILINPVFNR